MERESVKEAAARKLQCENIAISAKLRRFLGCGKYLSNKKDDLNQVGKKTQNENGMHEKTPVYPMRPEVSKLSNVTKLEGVGKRQLFGGMDSPSKRLKHAHKFRNLCAFWGMGWWQISELTQLKLKKNTIQH